MTSIAAAAVQVQPWLRSRPCSGSQQDLGVTESCLNLGGHRDLPAGVRRLRASLQQHPPDVVHTRLFAANVVGRLAARLVDCPVVSTSHDADHESIVRLGNPGLTRSRQLFPRLTRFALQPMVRRLEALYERIANENTQRHQRSAQDGG